MNSSPSFRAASPISTALRAAKEAIRAAGGLPFEIRTAAPSDFVTCAGRGGGYILPTRDLITNDIEVQVEGALLDGMLCLASCDKTTPGQPMAAGRLNIRPSWWCAATSRAASTRARTSISRKCS